MSDEDLPGQDEELPLPPAVDPKAPARRRLSQRKELQLANEFWRSVLADETGRRELWRLISDDGHAFEERFACGPNGFPQPEATWFNAGEQAFAMRLYQRLLALDPVHVRQMHLEHDSRFAPYREQKGR